jgi:CheY-like chemotaxis protein
VNSIAHVLIPHRNTRGIHTIILAGGEVSDIWIRSKRHDAVNQMPSLVEDPLCHTDVLKEQQRFWKRILIVDDDNDITTTFKAAIEDSNNGNDANKRIEVNTSNDPVLALLEFTPNFYDLLLVDINMPHIDGFELCEKILAIDINVKVCFMSCAAEVNQGLREIYPISLGCSIRKPVSIDYLLKRIRSELD